MFINGIIQKIPTQIGILLAHHSYDRYYKKIYDAKTFPFLPGLTIALEQQLYQKYSKTNYQLQIKQQYRQYFIITNSSCSKYFVYYSLICVNVYEITLISHLLLLLLSSSYQRRNYFLLVLVEELKKTRNLILLLKAKFIIKNLPKIIKGTLFVIVAVAVSTVRSLYAGTLATIWTTAPSLPLRRSPSIQLAAVCVFLATLTIAARCYASTNATHPLVQLNKTPSSFSPIDNSNAQTHSSNLVLSRLLLTNPHQLVNSDTSVIIINSKKLLHNQNSNTDDRNQFRTRRELRSTVFNYITNHQQEQEHQGKRHNLETKKIDSSNNNSNNNNIKNNHNYYNNFNSNNRNVVEIKGNQELRTKTKKDNLGINFATHKRLLLSNNSRRVQNLEKRSDTEYVLSAKNNSVGGVSVQVNSTQVNSTLLERQENHILGEQQDASKQSRGTAQPMPPVHDHNTSSVSDLGILVLVLSAIVLTVALGLVTCVLSHYRSVAGEGAADGGTAADSHDAAQTPTSAPMLSVVSAGAAAGVGGMDRLRGGRAARELAATRDRQVRLHAVHTDIAINLPPSIEMPDGEEHPFTSSRLHIRDPEQESEIHQKCIRPPPNRTVLESPLPYRSSSAGLLGSTSSTSSTSSSSSGVGGGGGCSDWSGGSAPLVVRCHSMSSTSKRPEAGSSGQKTDFLQRTVKILTGGGKKAPPTTVPTGGSISGHHTASTTSTSITTHQQALLPVVIVPTRPRRTSPNDQHNNSTTTGRPKPSV